MDNLAPGIHKRFASLFDAVAADPVGSPPSAANHGMAADPSVRDDAAPAHASVTMLGPSVGDDSQQSDRRLKEDVQRVGTTVFGLPHYHFKYIGKPETYEGVMAQDVLNVMPAAVIVGEDGYYRVNYKMLGIEMRHLDCSSNHPLGPPPPPPISDIRLKTNIRLIGTTVFGLPLYHFKYLGRPETYEGVMAQDVFQVMPSAVLVGADGYYRVNYGALGTSMRQVSA
jgi:hypothetical protein